MAVRASVARERWFLKLAVIGVAFGIAYWQWEASFMFPLRVFMTLIHEFGHGLAAIATGGRIERIEVGQFLGGLCYTYGGWRWVILPAGYLGSMAAGCALILAANKTKIDKFLSLALGLLLVGATWMWVRTGTGLLYGTLVGVALASSGWWLSEDFNELLLTTIGAMSCLASVFGLKYLFNARCGFNDAMLFSREIFPLPPMVWALAWMALSVACLGFTLHLAARQKD
ncbi:MAG: M50 family metallopeptidase [Elusimicrobia bacterium]|nr:M50 family metallopeptidase [Elusimicrobiota bacterium]